MKKFALYLISLLACVGLASSCSSDDDEMDFSGGTELAIGGEEISSITQIPDNCIRHDSNQGATSECFHSENEWKASEYYLYAKENGEEIDLPPIDWNTQTLVVAKYTDPYQMVYKDCKVIKKGDAYLVEIYHYGLLNPAFDRIGVFVVINRPGITNDKVRAKDVYLGGYRQDSGV